MENESWFLFFRKINIKKLWVKFPEKATIRFICFIILCIFFE